MKRKVEVSACPPAMRITPKKPRYVYLLYPIRFCVALVMIIGYGAFYYTRKWLKLEPSKK